MNFITKLNLCVPLPTDSQGKPPKREARTSSMLSDVRDGINYVARDIGIWPLFALLSVVVFVKHRANIGRLMTGTETRIGAKG